jgi:hypothetical protein
MSASNQGTQGNRQEAKQASTLVNPGEESNNGRPMRVVVTLPRRYPRPHCSTTGPRSTAVVASLPPPAEVLMRLLPPTCSVPSDVHETVTARSHRSATATACEAPDRDRVRSGLCDATTWAVALSVVQELELLSLVYVRRHLT